MYKRQVLACVLGKLDTSRHTAAELDTLVQAHLGNLGFAVEVHEDAEDRERLRPMFVMGSSALDEEVPWAAHLAEEVLRETDFSDTERIRDILGQRRIAMEQAFASAGHSAAMARVASYYPVSYTHLDVYKRQDPCTPLQCGGRPR